MDFMADCSAGAACCVPVPFKGGVEAAPKRDEEAEAETVSEEEEEVA